MSLSAYLPLDEILTSSPSNSIIAADKKNQLTNTRLTSGMETALVCVRVSESETIGREQHTDKRRQTENTVLRKKGEIKRS